MDWQNVIYEEDSRKAKKKDWRRANSKGVGRCLRRFGRGMSVAWKLSGVEKNSTSRRPLMIEGLLTMVGAAPRALDYAFTAPLAGR